MYAVGPFAVVFIAFLYGQRQANRTNEIEKLKAEKELQEQLTKTENENQKLEAKRHEDVQKVRNPSSTVDDLIKLWDSGPFGKNRGS